MPHPLLDKILPILSAVRDNEEKLQRILDFLKIEILPEPEEEDGSIVIPRKFEVLVRDIGQSLQVGMHLFLNLDTLETEEVPEQLLEEMWSYLEDEDENKEKGEDIALKYVNWQNVLHFEPLDSSEAFRIMEHFARQLDDAKVRTTLLDILNRRKPFAYFNSYIHNSIFRDAWFTFKNTSYENHVRGIIHVTLNEQK